MLRLVRSSLPTAHLSVAHFLLIFFCSQPPFSPPLHVPTHPRLCIRNAVNRREICSLPLLPFSPESFQPSRSPMGRPSERLVHQCVWYAPLLPPLFLSPIPSRHFRHSSLSGSIAHMHIIVVVADMRRGSLTGILIGLGVLMSAGGSKLRWCTSSASLTLGRAGSLTTVSTP